MEQQKESASEIVSILISVYRESKEWLEQSVASVVNQTYSNIEIIVVVDNPNNTAIYEVVDKYKSCRPIRVISHSSNKGLVYSLNEGLKFCTGKYIARMDADDVCDLERIEKQMLYMQRENLDLVGGEILLWDGDSLIRRNTVHSDAFCRKMIGFINPIAHPTWLVKMDVFKNLNGYREINMAEDYDFLIRAVQKGYRIGNLPDTVLKYRVSPSTIRNVKDGEGFSRAEYLRHNYKKGVQVEMEDFDRYVSSKRCDKYRKQMESYREIASSFRNKKSAKSFLKLVLCSFSYKQFIRGLCIKALVCAEQVHFVCNLKEEH